MKSVGAFEAKTHLSELLERVSRGEKITITRHGVPVAEVIPAGPDRKRKFLGDMIGTAEIVGDIVSPVIDLEDIEAYRD